MNIHTLFHDRSKAALGAALLAGILVSGIGGCSNAPKESSAQAMVSQDEAAAKMVEYGAAKMQKFLSYGQTEALKNMLGGARGIYIAPDIRGEAALLGTESGTGYLMCRHGKDWSDPVFFKLSEYSLGYQGGAKESHMIILLMTDEAVDQFIKGKMDIGGTGGFAVGNMGLGASGAGGLKGGLELLIFSTNEGVFLGGGMSTMSPKPSMVVNYDIYGKDFDVNTVLAGNGGKYAPAIKVRDILSEMVVQAWGIPTK